MNSTPATTDNTGATQGKKWRVWLRKVGWLGFFFFLLKGLIWLAIGYWAIR